MSDETLSRDDVAAWLDEIDEDGMMDSRDLEELGAWLLSWWQAEPAHE